MKRICLVWWSVALGTLSVVLPALTPGPNVQWQRALQATMEVPVSRTRTETLGQGVDSAASSRMATPRRVVDAPPWTIAYGKEFWRRPIESSTLKATAALPAHIDLGDVMERVSHAFEMNSASAVVRAQTYAARFDGERLRFSPHRLDERSLQADEHTEIGFRTRTVRRGDAVLFGANGNATARSVLGNTIQGALNLDSGVVEHYEARREGVEVCWVLQQPPAGHGPLVVEAELSGLNYAGQSEQGHHFADGSGIARVRLGEAILVEANGKETSLALVANGDTLRVTVPEDVLTKATFPIAIDPIISPEFGMDEPVLGYSIGDSMDPAIASNGSMYLAVWGDSRLINGYLLYGTRISSDGVVLDPRGLPLNITDGGTLYPAVASNGRDFLVAWRSGFTGGAIIGTRVTADGVALDGPGFLRIGYSSAHPRPSIASDGTDYLVVWEHEGNAAFEEDIFGARVSSHGIVIDSPPLVVHAGPNRHRGPAIAWNGSVYLAVWDDDGGNSNQEKTFGTRLSAGGTVLDGDGFEIGPGAPDTFPTPAVASDGHDFLVALGSQAVRVSGVGAVLGTTSLNVDGIPSVTFDGHNYFVVLLSGEIQGVRLSSAGTILGTTLIKSAVNWHPWSRPSVASLGGDFFVAWEERPVGQLQVFGAHVSGNGVASDTIPLSTDLNSQMSPAVASNGEDYLVVWSDLRLNTYEDIFGVRVSGAGAVLDPAGLPIRRAPLREWFPAVASDGQDYFVAWQEYPGGDAWQVLGARVLRDGTVLPPVHLNSARSDSRAPAVGSNGRDYLVAWSQWSGTRDLFMDLYAGRVSGAGALLDSPAFLVSSKPSLEGAPSIASDGTNYLVAWEGLFHPTFVSARRVTSAGVVLDPDGITLTTSTNEPNAPAVAFNGHNYLVVWKENAPSIGTDIFGARVGLDGTVLDMSPLGIATGPENEVYPRVASDGRQSLVLWHASRGPLYSADLFARRITAAGAFLESDGFLIQSFDPWVSGQLASNGTNYLVAYSGSDSNGLFRVRARLIAFPPCLAPDDCDGDGVLDLQDRCPETSVGVVVDAHGCSAEQRDDDGDGVPNGRDLCPHTPPGALVDLNGCSADQRDEDGDGVPDSRDECPDTPRGSLVGATGCPPEPTNCPPRIAWQASFGGSEFDGLYTLEATGDGGYILAGTSYSSADGNKSSTNPFAPYTTDLWVMRLDGSGQKMWEAAFGWSESENALSVKQIADGGFIVAGWSASGAGGNKTSPNLGQEDGWVIRLDASGNKLWDRSYGGGSFEYFFQVHELNDGGFLLGGISGGGPFGDGDYWVVRTDGQGNKLWEKFYGGTGTEQLFDLRPMPDGGFILGGGSGSAPSGNKTSPNFGSFDYWVVKVDANGDKLWDKSFGGSQDEEVRSLWPTSDGGFLLAGRSYSDVSGNKTSPSHGQSDYWLVRLAADGSKLWDKSIGGSGNDEWPTLAPLLDGGWIMGGNSASPPDGDKASPFYGGEFWIGDYWIVRLDAEGNLIWDQSFGGEGSEDLRSISATEDGGLILAGTSTSGATGNKTTAPFGREDWWVVKLAPPSADDCDSDRDGVPDARDHCPDTPSGAVVDAQGCSIAQLCPCDGSWRNHGEYVGCVIQHAWEFFRAELIDDNARKAITREAARSDCGRNPPSVEPVRVHLCPQTPAECRRDGIRLVLSGAPDGPCRIEKSTDLIDWISVETGEAIVSGEEILFPTEIGVPAQFYRVRVRVR